jgi:hypothetical protein
MGYIVSVVCAMAVPLVAVMQAKTGWEAPVGLAVPEPLPKASLVVCLHSMKATFVMAQPDMAFLPPVDACVL